MGAWIEMPDYMLNLNQIRSLPLWERGLKCLLSSLTHCGNLVAPLVGAWIEINSQKNYQKNPPVAPLVGAWIEM